MRTRWANPHRLVLPLDHDAHMRLLRIAVVLMGGFALALAVGVVAGGVYRRLRYPGVQDTDGLYDIGLVFMVGIAVTVVVEISLGIFYLVRRRKRSLGN